MVDSYAIAAIIIVSIVGAGLGGFMAAMIPFWRKQKVREEEYAALADIPPDKLTEEQKSRMKHFEQGSKLTFAQRYKYSALLGTVLGFVLALSSEAGVISAATQAGASGVGPVEVVSAFVKGLGLSGFFTFVTNQGAATK